MVRTLLFISISPKCSARITMPWTHLIYFSLTLSLSLFSSLYLALFLCAHPSPRRRATVQAFFNGNRIETSETQGQWVFQHFYSGAKFFFCFCFFVVQVKRSAGKAGALRPIVLHSNPLYWKPQRSMWFKPEHNSPWFTYDPVCCSLQTAETNTSPYFLFLKLQPLIHISITPSWNCISGFCCI